MPYQLAALLAAASWATSSLIAAEPVRRLGGPRFCRIRMLYASGMLLVLATVTGGWSSLSRDDLGLLAVSGLIGILLGDVALFTAMARIGPRRTAVMFTSNAPLAAVGGVLLYNESFNLTALGGAALTVVGIAMAVNFGSRGGTHAHVFERIEGSLRTGASWGGARRPRPGCRSTDRQTGTGRRRRHPGGGSDTRRYRHGRHVAGGPTH